MASNRIIGDVKNKQLAALVAIWADRLQDSRSETDRVLKMLSSASNGGDFASLASELGLVAIGTYTAVQQATDLVSIVTGINEVLNASTYLKAAVPSSATLNEVARIDQG